MNKILKITLIVFGTLALIAIIWIALVLNSFTGVHPYIPDPVYSADGSRVIVPSINFNKDDYDEYLLVHIEVRDAKSGDVLFQVQTRASDRMNWSVGWIDDDTVILDSSDIGSYCWAESDDGEWKETICPK